MNNKPNFEFKSWKVMLILVLIKLLNYTFMCAYAALLISKSSSRPAHCLQYTVCIVNASKLTEPKDPSSTWKHKFHCSGSILLAGIIPLQQWPQPFLISPGKWIEIARETILNVLYTGNFAPNVRVIQTDMEFVTIK